MVDQMNRRIHYEQGFIGSFSLSRSEWSRITDPDPDHPKGKHPQLGSKCTGKVEREPKDKVATMKREFDSDKNSSFCFRNFNNCTVTLNAISK